MSLAETSEFSRSLDKLNIGGLEDPDDPMRMSRQSDGQYYLPVQDKDQDARYGDDPDEEGDPTADAELPGNRRCGIGPCKPRWAQRLANLHVFAITYGVAGIWTITLGTLLASQITSIERHLGLTTTHTGIILSSNDVGYLIVVMVGSHVGKYFHIPRFLSISGILFGMTSFLMSLGRFSPVRASEGAGLSNETRESMIANVLCELNNASQPGNLSTNILATAAANVLDTTPVAVENVVDSSQPFKSWAFWLMIVAAALGGAVKSYRFPLFTHYVETNVRVPSNTAFLIGVTFTAMVFGPPIALLIGAFSSSIPVDLGDSNLSPRDPRWVGAWWLGFVIVGFACVATSTPVGFFPRFITKEGVERDVRKKAPDGKDRNVSKGKNEMFKDLPNSLRRIFHRPIFILSLLSGCIEAFKNSGMYSYSNKYIEDQYNKTTKEVSMTLGSLMIFSLAIGTFLGGVLTSKYRLGLRGAVIASTLRIVILFGLQCLYFVFGCNNMPYVGAADAQGLSCDCDPDLPVLICGQDKTTYFSPCYAGCSSGADGVFSNCTAISPGHEAMVGKCVDDCPFFIYYVATYFVLIFVACLGFVPGYIIIVRCVEQRDQSLAMGIIAFFNTLLGTLPSAVVFGRVIDTTCKQWHPSGGYCLLYDKEQFRLRFMGLNQSLQSVHMLIIFVLAYIVLVKKIGLRPGDPYVMDNAANGVEGSMLGPGPGPGPGRKRKQDQSREKSSVV